MCVGPGMKMGGTYTPRDFAKEGYINKGPGLFGLTRWEKPETQSSPMPQASVASGSPIPAYVDAQQPIAQQQQPQDLQATAPRPTTRRFSFNNGNFRIGESTMNSSDTGLNV